ncbi:hypothetical protein GCM10007385_09570 [Tateyamaria omphalii]|nr:hypothetical protein GCM10007385_09570 [Tateyamaria omphalii]
MAGDWGGIWPGFQNGFVAVGAQITLERNPCRHRLSFAVAPLPIVGQGDWSRFLYLASDKGKP